MLALFPRSAQILLTSAMLFFPFAAASQEVGVVVMGEGDCEQSDRIVISTPRGFTLAEQYRGSFDAGDKVYGELNRYGFKNVGVGKDTGRIYIDDFAVSETTAAEWCRE